MRGIQETKPLTQNQKNLDIYCAECKQVINTVTA